MTLEDLRCDKHALEGSIIRLLEDFVDKYKPKDINLNLTKITEICGAAQFDVDVEVTL